MIAIISLLMGIPSALFCAALMHRAFRQRQIGATLRIRSARGISEERFVRIGGIEQWMVVRGEDKANPALLLIHGGPGASGTIFTPKLRCWEEHFTVVQWDQRGSGKTLTHIGEQNTGELSLERLIQDGIEVAECVCEYLHKSNVILFATSFGSTFGLSMVRRRPDLFLAYVGADQNVGMARGQLDGFQATLARLRARGIRKGVDFLEKIGSDPHHWTPEDYQAVARWTLKSDSASFKVLAKLLKNAIWFAPGYRLSDIRAFSKGMKFSLRRLYPEIPGYDAWQEGTSFERPFFIFQGENDVVTPPRSARDFFDDVTAPQKDFILIPNAGHFAAFTQAQFVLSELLTRIRPLAVGSEARQGTVIRPALDDVTNIQL